MAGTGSIELVIGASGYLGSHVTRQLVARGDRVRVLARKSSSPAAFDDLDVEIRYGDLADREALRSAMCGPAKDEVADENFEFNWAKEGDEYVRTRVEAENLVLDYARNRGLPAVAMCVANTCGSGDYARTGQGQLVIDAASANHLRWADLYDTAAETAKAPAPRGVPLAVFTGFGLVGPRQGRA
ncbi:NAD-dependent epimerase/dehydratase family protein [Rhodococcus koreensis]|uniref:NAD dependent epimerase/dehydratase family protein n=1 Tax=Rhodococcus koreensis TaxID=99653 RepID=A0A1H4L0T1_9NOCA|nr:NAD-dependent epimerase/dehydratase family protein [Rhodococcus koreensis]SEB64076.1 NAD dependent epimerase/dehydratase family protein [Rhodococcus koreensis]